MEATTNTLADALLDDLDDLSDVDDEEQEQHEVAPAAAKTAEDDDDVPMTGNSKNQNAPEPSELAGLATKGSSFLQDSSLQKHLEQIRKSDNSKQSAAAAAYDKEQEQEEHRLIVQSNRQLARLSNELSRAHGELCQAYKPKFPELEELLPNPMQYKNAVKVVGNEMDISNVSDKLNQFLTSNQILTVSVSASTTSGRSLTPNEMLEVNRAINYVDEILQIQNELTAFVENRMENLAPNICALVGNSAIVAHLLGLAGGLEELSKIPACNLQVLGQTKQSGASRGGLSSANTRPNEGILANCDLVTRCAKHLQKKALKTVAAKLALAARCDYANANSCGFNNKNSTSGQSFRNEIETKIEKWEEPDKAPVLKALPKPDLTIKRRRGGRRIRRMKEKFEETALMKQANTRAFSTKAGEYGDDAMGLTMGLLDTADASGAGALRKRTEKRKMKYANTKASRKRAAQMQAQASAPTSGLSSVVFTPVQGMELVNPDARRDRVAEANRKWFSEDTGYKSSLPKK